jgi:predicted RND superfamily exporter protein/lauroyl/myristoyl acyltransferase
MIRKRWWWIAILLGVLVSAGIARLRLDVDVLDLLPDDVPVVHGLKLYQRNFTDSSELLLTVRGPDAAKAEAATRSLTMALRGETNLVSGVVWEPVWLEHPSQAAELIAYLWLNQAPADFAALTNRLSSSNIAGTLADTRDQLATSLSPMELARRSYDPYGLTDLPGAATGGASMMPGGGQELFASPDGTFRILFVKAAGNLANYRACIKWLARVKSAVQSECLRNGFPESVQIGYTGGPAFAAEISSGMEHDMTASIGLTSLIIAALFWIFHRRIVPMLWLLTLLAVILAATLALGGLLFGAINVVSLGFAGILLGLAVDYGVVHYQEALASPQAIIPEIRRAIGPSIFWAATTTISAFLVLNFGGLPGLAQLGSLVALGVMLSAAVMLFAFLPPLFRDRITRRGEAMASGAARTGDGAAAPDAIGLARLALVGGGTVALVLVSGIILFGGLPKLDYSADALRPRHSPAYAALDEIKTNIAGNREPLWLITQGRDETEVATGLQAAQSALEEAVSNRTLGGFVLPTPLWPRPENQSANRPAALALVAERATLHDAAKAGGFTTNALGMTDAILDAWQTAAAAPGVYWPSNDMSRWILDKVVSRTTNGFLAVGFAYPQTNGPAPAGALESLGSELNSRGFILSGWSLLGPAILDRVQGNFWKVVVPMLALVGLSLWLAFRRPAEILLSIAVLALSGLCLLAVMRLAGWSWNLMNLMAVPLMLGSGVDYSIFTQLALRRHQGNIHAAYQSVGRALLLCGGTAVAGFGSLSLSLNAGMASLGAVCAIGIGCNMLISVFLLPIWWRALAPQSGSPSTATSALYNSRLWRAGYAATRILPESVCAAMIRLLADVYWGFAPARREVTIQNLLPAVDGKRAQAEMQSRALFRNFAVKLADLWRYECGLPVENRFGQWSGWEHFQAAQAMGRGILVVTPHLGNWEFGGPLLTSRGVTLQVVTLAEPGRGFTELRKASRARWKIETLVVGDDPFAFVEIIRRLDAGATVALLIDRPPATSGVMVELFGRPFAASVAAAELARASGCVILPVFLPHTPGGYAAHILPPIPYERATLRKREARKELTQEIIRAFEPAIRQYADQWYHFVPVWPEDHAKK